MTLSVYETLREMLGEDPSWQLQAACRGKPQEWFFSKPGHLADFAKGKACCAICPVRAECLEFGQYEPAGLWGGQGQRQRQRARKGERQSAQAEDWWQAHLTGQPQTSRRTRWRREQAGHLRTLGYTMPEIAREMDVSLQTVRRLLAGIEGVAS